MYRTKLINLLKELKNSGAITQEQWGDHTRTVGRSHKNSGAITQEQWGDHTRTLGRSHKNSGAITQEQWGDHTRTVGRSHKNSGAITQEQWGNHTRTVGRSHKNSGATTQEQYYKVYPTATEPPKFYGLPKVHKPPCTLRPTVACSDSIMYGTARWVADILAPMVGKTPHHLQNSADLVNKLSQIRVDEDESLI